MMKVIVLTGVSGTGKTHARLNDPELKDLPYLDIPDICGKFPDRSTPAPVHSRGSGMIASTSGRVQAIGGGAGMSLVKIDNIISSAIIHTVSDRGVGVALPCRR